MRVIEKWQVAHFKINREIRRLPSYFEREFYNCFEQSANFYIFPVFQIFLDVKSSLLIKPHRRFAVLASSF